jgi:hypothetical protein
MMEDKYICPCGLICSGCLFLKKEIYENAIKLRDSIKSLRYLIGLQCKTTCREAGGCAIGGESHSC